MAEPLNILQFGATGQLSRELIKAASHQPNISLHALSRRQADFVDPEQIADAVANAKNIDAVINATAYTAVDKAEAEPDLARAINAEAVAVMAHACAQRNIPLIHVSTDYVFDGMKSEPYVETDRTQPLNIYGRTKLEGEEAIRAALRQHVILRTSWVYSAHGSNFVKTMLRLGAEREELRVVDDRHGAPTSAADLADAVLTIVTKFACEHRPDLFGTFHYSGGGETTWRKFAEAIFAQTADWAHIKAHIIPISISEYPTAAHRPCNSRLNCAKIGRVYGIVPPFWQESLSHVLSELEQLRGSV